MRIIALYTFVALLPFSSFAAPSAQESAQDAWAAVQIGQCAAAEDILEPLHRSGSPEAIKLLADMYAFGQCKEQDRAKAVALYIVAAKEGMALAQFSLGRAYEKGHGIPVDTKLAAYWYNKAAEQGIAGAQCNLGVLYLTGHGVEHNDSKGAELTERAAMQGYAPAQDNLGKIYRDGIARKQDYSKAEHWHRLAAEQGYPKGLVNLGAMSEMGMGVPPNRGLAYVLYRLAAGYGDEQALSNLRHIELSISAHQRQEANKVIDAWKPNSPLPTTFPYQ